MPIMRALCAFNYGPRKLRKDDCFTVIPPHIVVLQTAKLAVEISEHELGLPVYDSPPVYEVKVEEATAPPPAKRKRGRPKGSGKGKYKTRALTAE